MLLAVRNLNTYYGQSHIVQDVSFQIDQGELVCFLGRNGAGKTTVLRSIIGLAPIRSGSVVFKGKQITGLPSFAISKRGIGLVLEERGLFNDMTVFENLRAARRSRRGKNNESWPPDRVYQLFPLLRERKDQKAGTLSGGEQQMLAIARALRNEPELLMLDEPSEGLAPIIVKLLAESINIVKQDITILLVDQNFSFIQQVGERGYILEKGRIAHTVSIGEFAKEREVIESYLGVRRRN